MAPRRRTLLVAVGLTLVVGAATGLLLALSQGDSSLGRIARTTAIGLVYSTIIGLPAWAVMDRLFEALTPRGALLRWTVVIAVLLALSAAGCALAGLLFLAIGWLTPEMFGRNFTYAFRISLLIGAIITVSATVWERMRQRLDESQLAEARAKELATEARLNALEARVHPHFLFNTLNSVLSLIPADPVRAEELLEKLASLLRFSLDAGRAGLIPLADELRIVRDYLDIEAARLGERLRTSIDVAPDVESWLVPPFSLQTLAENSVRHAIAPRRSGGELRIHARRSGDRLELSVWDDGGGFSRAELRPGHGLENLESRLGALFGDRGGLAIERGGGGMAVTVAVPP
jgi:two-component system, LytTR family, sensor histidine kinase AlgZ